MKVTLWLLREQGYLSARLVQTGRQVDCHCPSIVLSSLDRKIVGYIRNNLYFENIHVIHVYRPVFQGEFEFWHIRSARAYLKDPGGPREQHTHGLQQGVVCFETLHVTHVYMPDFQGEYEFHTYRSVEDHLEGPGLLQEQHTHGLRPGITYILKTYM